jgi:hypothetical protein
MNGGSYTVSFSSGDDRSIMRPGSFIDVPCAEP